jgi:DNA recombination-dependent growth factor C
VPVYFQKLNGLAINLIAFVLHVPCVADQVAVTVSEKKRRAAAKKESVVVECQPRAVVNKQHLRVPIEVPETTTRTGTLLLSKGGTAKGREIRTRLIISEDAFPIVHAS